MEDFAGEALRADSEWTVSVVAEGAEKAEAEANIQSEFDGMGLNVTDITVDAVKQQWNYNTTVNELEVTTDGDTVIIDQDKFKKIQMDSAQGKFKDVLKETMSDRVFNESVANDPTVSDALDAYQKMWDEQRVNYEKQLKELTSNYDALQKKSIQQTMDNIAKRAPNATKEAKSAVADLKAGKITNDEFNTRLDEIQKKYPEEVKAMTDEIEKNKETKKLADEVKKDPSRTTWGQFARDTLGFLFTAVGYIALGLLIYSILKYHEHSMNGCWYVPNKAGKGGQEKIKVTDFTCNDDDKAQTSTGKASTCQDLNINANCSDSCKCSGSDHTGDCSTCCACGKGAQTCDSGTFMCVSKGLVGSFTDLVGEVGGDFGKLFGKLAKILLGVLKWVGILALVVLALVVVFIVIKGLFKALFGKKKKPPPGKPGAGKPGAQKPGEAPKPGKKGKPGSAAKVTVKVPVAAGAGAATRARPRTGRTPTRATRAVK